MAYRKNKRRFDPRYFMNERMEQIDEMIPGDGGFPRRFSDDDEEWPQKEKEVTPGDMAQELWDARQNSGPEALDNFDERSVEDQLANLAWGEAEQEEIDDRNRKFNQGGLEENNLEEASEDEGCAPSESPEFSIHIKVFPGQPKPNILSGDDLDAMVKTAEIWKKNPAIEISYMSPEIEKKLGGDLEES